MQPIFPRSRTRSLHRFDARSLVLFASLTMSGTHAIMAQSLHPSPALRQPAASVSTPSPAPTQVAQAQPTPDQAFDRADANGDGKLTREEFAQGIAPPLEHSPRKRHPTPVASK